MVLGDNTPLNKLLYHIPLYNSFRAPTRNWFEFSFALAILAGLGFDYIIKAKNKIFKKNISIVILLIIILIISFFTLYFYFNKTVEDGSPNFFSHKTESIINSFSLEKSSIYIPHFIWFAFPFLRIR